MHGQKDGQIQSTDLFRYVQTGVDENGKVQGIFAPTGNLPTFYEEFAAKGQPVDESVFTKGAVPLDENGEPDLSALKKEQAQSGETTVPPAPPVPTCTTADLAGYVLLKYGSFLISLPSLSYQTL